MLLNMFTQTEKKYIVSNFDAREKRNLTWPNLLWFRNPSDRRFLFGVLF